LGIPTLDPETGAQDILAAQAPTQATRETTRETTTQAQATQAPTPSPEQTTILDLVAAGSNIVADCVAGAGKTTTVLFIAAANPGKRILQVTYNAALKEEVRRKAVDRGADNLVVHTYHSLAVKHYDPSAHTDAGLKRALEGKMTVPLRTPFDIVVIDEAQDMTPLYYTFLKKFLSEMSAGPFQGQLLVFGDRFQSIYAFKDADRRFLTCAPRIWTNSRTWATATLSTSYRLTHQMAAFMNQDVLGDERIRTVKSGPPVQYIVLNTFRSGRLADLVASRLGTRVGGAQLRPADIFVLAPSIKSPQSPVRDLERALVERRIPVYYPTSDDRPLDDAALTDKIVFCSFHQAKGRERKVVIVFGFDAAYYLFHASGADESVCPEALYVAATRASHELIILQQRDQMQLPCMQTPFERLDLCPHLHVRILDKPKPKQREAAEIAIPKHSTTVTDLTKFLRDDTVARLEALLNSAFVTELAPHYTTSIPTQMSFVEGQTEDVSDIAGIAIPALFEAEVTEHMATIHREVLVERDICMASGKHRMLVAAARGLTAETVPTAALYARIATLFVSFKEEIYNRTAQIKSFDWLQEADLGACMGLMRRLVGGEIEAGADDFDDFDADDFDADDFDADDFGDDADADNDANDDDDDADNDADNDASDDADDDAAQIPVRPQFEFDVELETSEFPRYGKVTITGRYDVLTPTTILELKVTSSLTLEHRLQLFLYAWMWAHGPASMRTFRLVNLKTGEVQALQNGFVTANGNDVVALLLENKYGHTDALEEDAFVARCQGASVTGALTSAASGASNAKSAAAGANKVTKRPMFRS